MVLFIYLCESDNQNSLNAFILQKCAYFSAAYLEIVIFGGFMKCNGIFFIAYQERFKSSASETSLILTIQNMTMSFTGTCI